MVPVGTRNSSLNVFRSYEQNKKCLIPFARSSRRDLIYVVSY